MRDRKFATNRWKLVIVFLCCLVVILFRQYRVLDNSKVQNDRITVLPHLNRTRLARGNCSDIVGPFELRILVITYNRPQSLTRLLQSLNNSTYDGDRIRLEVWIDRDRQGVIDTKTLHAALAFSFRHGSYGVCPHISHVGLYGQWLSTWKPSYTKPEIAVILEDDLTVSPYFYKYLKDVHNKYDNHSNVNGFALQGISIKHSGSGSGLLQAPENDLVFLYPVVGTWGYSPSKVNWIRFLDWYNAVSLNKSFQPLVPGNVASSWYTSFQKRGETDGMWSMWYIYYAWLKNEFTLYSNYKGTRVFFYRKTKVAST